ncbi:MAG: DUF4255 domain-containing protein [Deltaproteobacteria bacterium]|nr:DUF4255 domain-containing protein [Deltaproteobacteria bacterium]
MITRVLPSDYSRGPTQGRTVIGEVTEAVHKFLLDGWNLEGPPPRIEEDLSFIPKDREEVVYIMMYKVTLNNALMNSKRLRLAKFEFEDETDPDSDATYWERPPLYLELHYAFAVHSKFRSDAERLLGWVLLRLHEATHLVYRPRRFVLPGGRVIDSRGRDWKPDTFDPEVIMEKVSLSLVDDLTVGDAINFFTINEAPYRPYVTYKARCAMEGALISGPAGPVDVDYTLDEEAMPQPEDEEMALSDGRTQGKSGRMSTRPVRRTHHVEPNPQDSDTQ